MVRAAFEAALLRTAPSPEKPAIFAAAVLVARVRRASPNLIERSDIPRALPVAQGSNPANRRGQHLVDIDLFGCRQIVVSVVFHGLHPAGAPVVHPSVWLLSHHVRMPHLWAMRMGAEFSGEA